MQKSEDEKRLLKEIHGRVMAALNASAEDRLDIKKMFGGEGQRVLDACYDLADLQKASKQRGCYRRGLKEAADALGGYEVVYDSQDRTECYVTLKLGYVLE